MTVIPEGWALGLGDGSYSYPLAGQRYYSDAVARLLQQRRSASEASFVMPLVVALVAEPTNDHDNLAIKAVVGDDIVGYINGTDTHLIHLLFEYLDCSELPIHALIEYIFDGDVLREADIFLDFEPLRVPRMIADGRQPELGPPIKYDPISEKLALIEWMGENFLEDQIRLRAEIEQIPIDIELQLQQSAEQAQLNVEIKEAIDEFERLASDFRASATPSEIIGLGPFRDGDRGICYLCGGWTDSSDNNGRVEYYGFVKPGLLYPTDDHVIPRQSVAAIDGVVHGINPDVVLVREWNYVYSEDNIRTAHFSCNSRKGTTPISELSLPFPKPRNYDEEKILKMRARYKRVRDAKQKCRELTPSNYVVCSDRKVNSDRKLLKERLNEVWRFATNDFV